MSATYVRTSTGKILVQIPDPEVYGGCWLCDGDQSWPGGLGIATDWTAISEAEVSEADRDRLGWILEQAREEAVAS